MKQPGNSEGYDGTRRNIHAVARHVPIGLTGLRALLAPVVIALAWLKPDHAALGACLLVAFLSDVFDGIIARRLGIATPGLRRLDSIADSLFYLACVGAAWHLHPAVLLRHVPALALLAALELARYVFDLVKFRREASYHMWSSKLWGIFLFAGFFALLALDRDGVAVTLAIYAGIVADAEGLLISAILPAWRSDVPSFVHALRQAKHRGLTRRAGRRRTPRRCNANGIPAGPDIGAPAPFDPRR